MKDTADRYISAQKVAEILSCTDQYVYSLVREETLDAIKIGPRALRISERSLNAFIDAGRVDPEDYFAPEAQEPEPSPQKKIVHSNWMDK